MLIPRVKICGLCDVDQAVAAANFGADAIGLVFYEKSRRAVSIEQARQIVNALPPFIKTVGLFVNETEEQVRRTVEDACIDLLQFHGKESPEYCEQFNLPYIKALSMKPGIDIQQAMSGYHKASGILLDTYHPEMPGGTGEKFNWDEFPTQASKPLILAGGLTPENVAEAVKACNPYAVDVSGGVESAPGVKSSQKIQAFIQGAKSVEVVK